MMMTGQLGGTQERCRSGGRHCSTPGASSGPGTRPSCPSRLHHANIDRLWARWQTDHPQAKTPRGNSMLQPPPLFGVKVATQLDITALGYSYN